MKYENIDELGKSIKEKIKKHKINSEIDRVNLEIDSFYKIIGNFGFNFKNTIKNKLFSFFNLKAEEIRQINKFYKKLTMLPDSVRENIDDIRNKNERTILNLEIYLELLKKFY